MTKKFDPHTLKAAEMFKVLYSEVTPEQRLKAKQQSYRERYGGETRRWKGPPLKTSKEAKNETLKHSD